MVLKLWVPEPTLQAPWHAKLAEEPLGELLQVKEFTGVEVARVSQEGKSSTARNRLCCPMFAMQQRCGAHLLGPRVHSSRRAMSWLARRRCRRRCHRWRCSRASNSSSAG